MKRPAVVPSIIVIFALFFLIPSCSDSPTDAPDPGANATGQIDPSGDSDFLLGIVSAGTTSGRIEVWAQNLTVESDEIVSFDAVLVNRSRWPIPAPIHFVITDIRPDSVVVANADMEGPEGPVFDFSDDVGDDDILDINETSAPVNMKFRWPEPMAFAIGFRIDAGGALDTGFVSGIVFNDLNRDGRFDRDTEPGIPGIVVELMPSAREILYRTHTDDQGRYRFEKLTADVYKARAHARPFMLATTPNPLIVTLVELPDGTVTGFDGADFGFAVENMPPELAIFGPVAVGPASPSGTMLDTTFTVPDFFAPVDLYLKVVPPPITGPFPLRIDEASVAINDVAVWEFACEPPDSVCMPGARVLLDPNVTMRENTINIRTTGDPMSFLMFSIAAVTKLDTLTAGKLQGVD